MIELKDGDLFSISKPDGGQARHFVIEKAQNGKSTAQLNMRSISEKEYREKLHAREPNLRLLLATEV